MKYLITLDSKTKKKICECYGITPQYLNMALAFKRHSKKCIVVRSMALQNGGTLYEESTNYKNIKL